MLCLGAACLFAFGESDFVMSRLPEGRTAGVKEEVDQLVCSHILRTSELLREIAHAGIEPILEVAEVIASCFRSDHKVLICGNGGSAADAQHIAAEFVNTLTGNLRPGMPAIALTTDTSFLTAYANDYGYDGVFERQVLTLGRPGDVLMAISTSGNSENVIKSVIAARERGLITVGLGGEGGKLSSLVDHGINVPSSDTQHVQECLLTIEHAICLLVEKSLFG